MSIKTYTLATSQLHIFSGTYNTGWEPQECSEDGSHELQVEYGFDDMMRSIATAYREKQDKILEMIVRHQERTLLSFDNFEEKDIVYFIKSLKFTGRFYSPKEYNFYTDSVDFEIEIDSDDFIKQLKSLESSKEFSEFLKEHYSSGVGFISFIPNNYEELLEHAESDDERHQEYALCALLGFFIHYEKSERDYDMFRTDIEILVYEYWSENGYCGLKYETREPDLQN